MQIDRADNTEFKYLYCHKFKWSNPLENEQTGGHPKEKTIYRGWYNTETKSYRVMSNPGVGLYMKNLKETDSFPQGYTCDFEEVTKSNILQFKNITEENLTEMLQWLEYNNADLKERLGFTKPPSDYVVSGPPPFNPIIAVINQATEEQQAQQYSFQGFMESGEELLNINPTAFEKIWNLIENVLETTYNIPEGPIDHDYLRHSPQGMSTNINDAYKCLYRYAGNDRRTNENPDDLYEAMGYILTELIRRDYNNLDQ